MNATGGAGVFLIVDDESEIRALVERLVARTSPSFVVRSAPDAESALVILKSERVACMITDLRLPGRSGIDLVTFATQRQPDFPCAIMTGYADDVIDGQSLSELPLVGLLRKPFSAAALIELLRTLAERAQPPMPKP